MSSDGISKRAKHGRCRICQRTRKTDQQVKAVGEIHHGFATGHIWECIDIDDCNKVASAKLQKFSSGVIKTRIEAALKFGRFKEYLIIT